MKDIPNKPEIIKRPTGVAVASKQFADYVLTLEKEVAWMADHIGQLNDLLDDKAEREQALLSGYREENELTKLDQFAIHLQAEVYKQVMHELQFAKLAKEYDGMNVYQIVAKRTYDIAEAMQAESQRRQGGAA